MRELILEQAAPVVRQALRRKLRFYAGGGRNSGNPDAEDLYQDVMAKLVRMLQQMQAREAPGEFSEIKDFRQYATRVAVNSCNDYLRLKYPQRTRLKDKVREALDRHGAFAVWRSEQGELICGLAGWDGEPREAMAAERLRALEEQPELLSARQGRSGALPLTQLLLEIFEWVRSPLELERLVGAAAGLLELREHQFESLDEEGSALPQRLSAEGPGFDQILEERATLERLWRELCRLPPNQRDTMIFTFSDSKGDDLLSLLYDAKVVTPAQMAAVIGVSEERMMEIWARMPLGNIDAADLMRVDRHVVNKWRHRARKHLEQCFAKR